MSNQPRRPAPPPLGPPKFAVGDRVRIRAGIPDATFRRYSIGGWVGTVVEQQVEGGERFIRFELNPETLQQLPAFYTEYLRIQGISPNYLIISELGLEAHDGSPVAIEMAEQVRNRKLDPGDPDDRVRLVFGLGVADAPPEVTVASMTAYYNYLLQHVQFPFAARKGEQRGRLGTRKLLNVSILGFEDLAPDCHRFGVICTAQYGRDRVRFPLILVEEVRGKAARLIDDYRHWFYKWKNHKAEE